MGKKKKAYISHSYWDTGTSKIENIKEALRKQGYETIDPADLEYPKYLTLHEQLRQVNFPIIEKCDLIVVVRTISPGVKAEKEYAEKLGKEVRII